MFRISWSLGTYLIRTKKEQCSGCIIADYCRQGSELVSVQGIGDTDLPHTRLSLVDSRFEKCVEMEPSLTLDINLLFSLRIRQVSPFSLTP